MSCIRTFMAMDIFIFHLTVVREWEVMIAIELNLMIQAYRLVMLKICSVLLIRRLTISRFVGYLVIILKKDLLFQIEKELEASMIYGTSLSGPNNL